MNSCLLFRDIRCMEFNPFLPILCYPFSKISCFLFFFNSFGEYIIEIKIKILGVFSTLFSHVSLVVKDYT